MKNVLLLIVLNLTSLSLLDQPQVKGSINANGKPAEFANILLFQASDSAFVKGVVTDINGQFEIPKIEKGRYYLTVTMIGFEPFESPVFTINNTLTLEPFKISLQANSQVLDEITVVAKKPLFEQQIDRTVVNVQNSITATGSSALEILERSPGINIDRMNEQIAMQGKQGVVVMLNGKRMRMEMAALIQLLQNMPSNNIEKIELITSPPASFDAEGNAGVINIVTIKNQTDGMNGNATLNGSYGLRAKYGGSLNINIRKKWFNVFSDLSVNHNYTQDEVRIHRGNTFENHITNSEILSDRPAFTKLYNGRLGADFYFSERSIFGVLLSGYYRHWDMDATTSTEVNDNMNEFLLNDLDVHEINEWEHWMANINFRHTFLDDSKLSFDFDYLDYIDHNPVDYVESNLDVEGTLLNTGKFSSTKDTPIQFKVAKLDYSKKVSEKFSFETGIKGTLSTFVNDVSLKEEQNGMPVYDSRFTDVSDLDEKIAAAYVSTDYSFNEKITAKAGLRYEYYDSQLNSNKDGELVDRQFGRLFPSLFLTYQINDNHQLQLSYSERINRPSINEMASFFIFWGHNTVFTGNPAIKPTISKQINASYRYKSLLFNAEFSDRKDPLTYQPKIVAEENFFIINPTNMQDAKTAMLSVSAPWQIADWWESRYNLAAYWTRLQPIYEGKIIREEDYFFTANMTQNFKLPRGFNLEITSGINSARDWGLGRGRLNGSLNMGIQKSLSSNTKISFNWNNILNLGSFWEFDFDQPELNLDYTWRYQQEGNVLRLSFSWQFGDTKIKSNTDRKTGSEEERQRMN